MYRVNLIFANYFHFIKKTKKERERENNHPGENQKLQAKRVLQKVSLGKISRQFDCFNKKLIKVEYVKSKNQLDLIDMLILKCRKTKI